MIKSCCCRILVNHCVAFIFWKIPIDGLNYITCWSLFSNLIILQIFIFLFSFFTWTILFESIRTPFSYIIPLLESTFFGVAKGSYVIEFKHPKNAAAAATFKGWNWRAKIGFKHPKNTAAAAALKGRKWREKLG